MRSRIEEAAAEAANDASASAAAINDEDTGQGDSEDEESRNGSRNAHFTTVSLDQLDPRQEDRERSPWISPQTWLLAAGLVTVGLTWWYFLQDPSADRLYDKIVARTADDATTSLLRAESDIRQFLVLYPSDTRCLQMREYEQEIELHRLDEKFRLRAKGLAGTKNLLPVEEAYLEAISQARLDPARAAAKLQALIDLYEQRRGVVGRGVVGRDIVGPTGKCVELARRRKVQLEEQLDRRAAEHLPSITRQLDQADALRETAPERARAMYLAVLELYAEKPWAATVVARARTALDRDQP